MKATTVPSSNAHNRRSTLTFVGFATWLEEHPSADGCHIEVWRDAIGRLFAWTTSASGHTTVRELPAN